MRRSTRIMALNVAKKEAPGMETPERKRKRATKESAGKKVTVKRKRTSTPLDDISEREVGAWQGLPDELYLHVLSFVTHRPDTLATCLPLNRRWNRIAADNVLWQEVARTRYPNLAAEMAARFVDLLDDIRACVKRVATCCACQGRLNSGKRTYPFWKDGDERRDITPIYLCGLCSSVEADNTLIKGDARAQYAVTDADLDGVPHVRACNPYYRRAAPTYVYVRKFVEIVSYRKHGGPEGLAAKKQRNMAIAAKRNMTLAKKHAALEELEKERETKRAAARQERESQLVEALRERGLERRSDSRLCDEYVEGRSEYDLDHIVDIMEEMRFYYRRTRYVHHVKRIKNEHREWGERWRHDEVSEDAKERALDQWLKAQLAKGMAPDAIRALLPRSLQDTAIPP